MNIEHAVPIVIPASHLQKQSGSVIRQVAKDRKHLLIERGGIPVAVMLPVEDYERLKATAKPPQT